MHPIGFSTGALALGDFRHALRMLAGSGATAVELSALRMSELPDLLAAVPDMDLDAYRYVSLHAPAGFPDDAELARHLEPIWERNWPVVVHPNDIRDFDPWRRAGALVCIENMDSRKSTGRTARELAPIFDRLPDASLCFDTGHARHVDATLTEAMRILAAFGRRIGQLHVSEVDSRGRHHRLTLSTISALEAMSGLIEPSVPIILESPVATAEIEAEMEAAASALCVAHARAG